jgi:two-component system, chemotaxis family, response regulator Rcp1
MTRSINQAPLEILLVEDNLGDIRLAEEIFKECEVPNHLSVARDGEEAMACAGRAGTPRCRGQT